MINRTLTTGLLAALAACAPIMLLCGCRSRDASAGADGGPVQAIVSIEAQAYLVRRVGGERVAVATLVPPGSSPHTFEPTPRQMAALAEARVYFLTGLPFEQALLRRMGGSFRRLRVVDTTAGLELIAADEHHHHDEHDDHQRDGEAMDPHVWLDPTMFSRQAEAVATALAEIDPAGAETYRDNLRKLQQELTELDRELAETLRPLAGQTFFVYHPAYGYFARRYGLVQVAVEIDGKEPSARQVTELISHARQLGARVVFVQPQFSQRSAQAIAEAIGGTVAPMDPLAGDYPDNLRRMARLLAEAGPQAPAPAGPTPDHDHHGGQP